MINQDLQKIRYIGDFQYGIKAGEILFPNNIEIVYSRNTGRIKHIFLDNVLQATFRPTDGLLTLTIHAAQRLIDKIPNLNYKVIVQNDVSEFISKGRNVFAKHVINAGDNIRPGDETLVLDENQKVIAVGKALLTSDEIKSFKRGVAVKVRRGSED
ncbi:pseudouridine synthase [Candidatus Bathyarchaeota archaeon]|nr:pseudouridine synthase [Candidatus Bathyarchaeota archaeon]